MQMVLIQQPWSDFEYIYVDPHKSYPYNLESTAIQKPMGNTVFICLQLGFSIVIMYLSTVGTTTERFFDKIILND